MDNELKISGGGDPNWFFKLNNDGTWEWNPGVIKAFVDSVKAEIGDRIKHKTDEELLQSFLEAMRK